MMDIHTAQSSDAAAIAKIWNPVIKNTVSTFTNIEKSTQDIEELITKRAELNHGFYVAAIDGEIIGFATYGPFRSGPGYARTMEHSIFLADTIIRQGVGKALMARLEHHAKDMKVHSLIAGLSAENINGIKFHQTLGYDQVATIKKAGFKFDRWHDLVLMQRFL